MNKLLKLKKSDFSDRGIFIHTLSKNKEGNYVARRQFYYTKGKTSLDFANEISLFPGIEILDQGEVYKPFKGGASTANSSHWYVIFKIK